MRLTEVKNKAKGMGVKPGKMKKGELIRALQVKEGNDACFGSGSRGEVCDQEGCCFRTDCLYQ